MCLREHTVESLMCLEDQTTIQRVQLSTAETMSEIGDKVQGVAEKSRHRTHDDKIDDDLRAILSKAACQVFFVDISSKF